MNLSSEWDKPLFSRRKSPLEKVIAHANKGIEKSQQFFNKIKLREIACGNRAKAIPKNATVRKRYITCNKANCYRDQHGPYYYAYWKDSKSSAQIGMNVQHYVFANSDPINIRIENIGGTKDIIYRVQYYSIR